MMALNIKHPPQGFQFLTDHFQQGLAKWNSVRLEPALPDPDWQRSMEDDRRMLRLEGGFIEELRHEIGEEAKTAPLQPNNFLSWFEELKISGPGQNDRLFDWLAEEADFDDFQWFMEQEAAGEAGFDDLVAMTQVKLPLRPKLEMACNYWDEMGRGREEAMHGPMLETVSNALNIKVSIETTVWESLALANAMTAMASTRRYAWHSVGALGVIELTAPTRATLVAKGLKRIGLNARQRRYFDLHAHLDIKHSADWNREVILPAIEEEPARARAIAEGALIRLRCGERCFNRYRHELGVG